MLSARGARWSASSGMARPFELIVAMLQLLHRAGEIAQLWRGEQQLVHIHAVEVGALGRRHQRGAADDLCASAGQHHRGKAAEQRAAASGHDEAQSRPRPRCAKPLNGPWGLVRR